MQHELRPGLAINVGYFRTWYGNFNVTDNLALTPSDYDEYCVMSPSTRACPAGAVSASASGSMTSGRRSSDRSRTWCGRRRTSASRPKCSTAWT